MRRQLLVYLATAVLFGGGAALAMPRGGAERVTGSIGVNRLPLRSAQTTYRLTLDGRASLSSSR